jgi:hypothetical protein
MGVTPVHVTGLRRIIHRSPLLLDRSALAWAATATHGRARLPDVARPTGGLVGFKPSAIRESVGQGERGPRQEAGSGPAPCPTPAPAAPRRTNAWGPRATDMPTLRPGVRHRRAGREALTISPPAIPPLGRPRWATWPSGSVGGLTNDATPRERRRDVAQRARPEEPG